MLQLNYCWEVDGLTMENEKLVLRANNMPSTSKQATNREFKISLETQTLPGTSITSLNNRSGEYVWN